MPTGILCSPLHLSSWSQRRIQFVPFILLTKLMMTQLDTKRKGFPNTSYLISSTVHHAVNIFLLNYKKKPFPCVQLLSSGEGPTGNSVEVGKTKRDQGTVNLMKKTYCGSFLFSLSSLIHRCIHQSPKNQKSSHEKPLNTLMSKPHCYC